MGDWTLDCERSEEATYFTYCVPNAITESKNGVRCAKNSCGVCVWMNFKINDEIYYNLHKRETFVRNF